MLVYKINTPGSQELPRQAVVMSRVKNIIIFDIPNHDFIREDYLPFNAEFEKKYFDILSSLETGKTEAYNEEGSKDYTVISDEDLAKGLELKKHITLVLVKLHYEKLINFSLLELGVEKTTWERQKTEADTYVVDPDSDKITFIRTLAEKRGIDLSLLVEKIQTKSVEYAVYVANMLGEQHNIEIQVESVVDVASLNALDIIPETCKF
jgi:hypothetical protein